MMNHSDRLSASELLKYMKTEWLGNCAEKIHFHEKIDSTNLEAKRLGRETADSIAKDDAGSFGGQHDAKEKLHEDGHGILVVADCQESGRGRLGRTWSSPAGCGLWMSMVLKPTFSVQQASMVTLVTAVAVMKAIEKVTGVQAQIKWPNDLVAEGKKICGILTELSVGPGGKIDYLVPGIGINVNNSEFPEELCGKATSLKLLTGQTVNRAELAAAVCQEFETAYANFNSYGNLTGMMDLYNERLVNRNKQVVISDGAGSFTCISEGIDETGALLVCREDGTREAVCSGEVSVRGIYGYV